MNLNLLSDFSRTHRKMEDEIAHTKDGSILILTLESE
jgi:hypothetical protein